VSAISVHSLTLWPAANKKQDVKYLDPTYPSSARASQLELIVSSPDSERFLCPGQTRLVLSAAVRLQISVTSPLSSDCAEAILEVVLAGPRSGNILEARLGRSGYSPVFVLPNLANTNVGLPIHSKLYVTTCSVDTKCRPEKPRLATSSTLRLRIHRYRCSVG
jgi:hypothetical protein